VTALRFLFIVTLRKPQVVIRLPFSFDLFERRRAHVELAAGGRHELAAKYFDARIHAVELSFQWIPDQPAGRPKAIGGCRPSGGLKSRKRGG
jgi:hypothetical protein